jgi:hypothetical protein
VGDLAKGFQLFHDGLRALELGSLKGHHGLISLPVHEKERRRDVMRRGEQVKAICTPGDEALPPSKDVQTNQQAGRRCCRTHCSNELQMLWRSLRDSCCLMASAVRTCYVVVTRRSRCFLNNEWKAFQQRSKTRLENECNNIFNSNCAFA